MAKRRLNPKDLDHLLNHYRAERRRLNFQLEKIRAAIAELKEQGGDASAEAGEAPVKRGPGRPRKNAAAKPARRRKPGRRKKREVKDGYRLSDWDNTVIDLIAKANRLLPKEDLLRGTIAWAKKYDPKMKQAEVEAKLTRVLQKLSGKRGMLGTYQSGLRRGYHYGVKDWFFASSGKLRKKHLDKLVLQKK